MSDDTLDPLVTQCPNCDTRFRVTESQLQVASGRVRCGACLHVFDGTQYLLIDGEPYVPGSGDDDVDALLAELEGDTPASQQTAEEAHAKAPVMDTQAPAEAAPPGTAGLSRSAPSESGSGATTSESGGAPDAGPVDHSALDLAALEEQLLAELRGQPKRLEDFDLDLPGLTDSEAGAPQVFEPAPEAPSPVAEPRTDADSAAPAPEGVVAPEPIAQDEPVAVEPPAVSGTPAIEPDPPAGHALEPEAADAAEGAEGAEGADKKPETAPARGAEATNAPPPRTSEPTAPGSKSTVENQKRNEEPASLSSAESASESALESANAGAAGDEPKQTAPARNSESWAEATFAEAELYQDTSRRSSRTTWLVLAVALVAIPAQVLWFQFESWGKQPAFRPLYEVICAVAGCELPQRRDVNLIVARNSVLRDHPEVDNALIYDALLVNTAEFAQPFPVVELTLTSIRGDLVAGRRFQPDEYLNGALKQSGMMQPRTPVHVSLEIQDPGEAPLNFRVRFL